MMDPDREIIVFCLVCFVILGLFIAAICGAISIYKKRDQNANNAAYYNNSLVNDNYYGINSMADLPASYVDWQTPNMTVAPGGWPRYENQRANFMTDANVIYDTNNMENDCINAALLPHGNAFVYP